MTETGRLAYRPREASALLGLGKTKLADLLKRGEIRSVKLDGKAILIPRQALQDFIDKKLQETEANTNE